MVRQDLIGSSTSVILPKAMKYSTVRPSSIVNSLELKIKRLELYEVCGLFLIHVELMYWVLSL